MNEDVYENYVLQVIKEGNLTKAAANLGISQPALSSGLTTMEKRLGFRIFDRKLSPVQLTAEGKIYSEYIRKKKALTADFEARIAASQGERDYFVSIGAPIVYSESIVAEAVSILLQEHPEYCFSIRTAPLQDLIEMAETGQIDCFISTSDEIPSDFGMINIKEENLFLCIPAGDPLNRSEGICGKERLSTEDFSLLSDLNFIMLEPDQPVQQLTDGWLKENGISLKSSLTVNQVSTAVQLASMGLGACFASDVALNHPDLQEKLRIYPMGADFPGRGIYLASPGDSYYQSSACGDLLQYLSDNFLRNGAVH